MRKNSEQKADTLEKRVVDAILERPAEVIEIDGEKFPIAPPTVATLMLVSELVADMPMTAKDTDNVLIEVLATAKDMAVIGKIAAVLILGAKRVAEKRSRVAKVSWHWSWRCMGRKPVTVLESEVDWLARRVLEEVSPSVLMKVLTKRLLQMGVTDFFGITTSLSEANQLRKTREVATQFGERS